MALLGLRIEALGVLDVGIVRRALHGIESRLGQVRPLNRPAHVLERVLGDLRQAAIERFDLRVREDDEGVLCHLSGLADGLIQNPVAVHVGQRFKGRHAPRFGQG